MLFSLSSTILAVILHASSNVIILPKHELNCVAYTVMYESGNQPIKTQLAVADTIYTRVTDSRFPDSPCKVVLQKNQFHWTHNKTWLANMKHHKIGGKQKYEQLAIAYGVAFASSLNPTRSSYTYFASNREYDVKIGGISFKN